MQKQSPMRRILGNFGFLIRGRGIAGVMKFAAIALMARALGPAEFGMLVLIQTYSLFVRGLFNVQLFEAIVRYGVPLHDKEDKPALQRLITICWRLDKITSISAALLAILIAPLIGPLLGIVPEHLSLLTLYSITLFIQMGNGTATGILRLFDRFDILGKQMTIGPSILFSGVLIAWWLNSSLLVFLSILAISSAAEKIYLSWYGWREFQRNIHPNTSLLCNKKIHFEEFSGLRRFLWITYWQSNIDLVYKNISIMLIGSFLGASEAGLLRLARQFSSFIAKPAALIRQVVFPDLTRSWHQSSSDFKIITYRTALYACLAGILFVVLSYFYGDLLLTSFVGKEYLAAAPLLTILLLAASFDLAAASLRAAAYAAGDADKVLILNAAITLLYIGLFITFTMWLGLIGAGIAACIAAAIAPVALALIIRKHVME